MGTSMRNNLGAGRRERGWTQAQVARAAGISRQAYAAIESGEAVPSTEIALRLAAAFGRSVEELFRLGDALPETKRARWSGAGEGGGRVRLARVGGRLHAYAAGEGDRLARRADGVVVEREETEVVVGLFEERPPEPSLVVAGCDPAFGLVAEVLGGERGFEVLALQRTSLEALASLARGEAHVAGVHLRDPETGEYNQPWIRRMIPFACTRISFVEWEQGLLVGAGNPLGIASLEDLARPGVRFLNRQPGSGSRALLDERLRRAGVPPERIPGYETAARGHIAVAEAIAAGLADAGVGIRAAGAAYGLGVIPLEVERYDLIVPDHFLDLPAVQALLEVLGRTAVRAQVEALGGYDAGSMGLPA